MEFKDWLMIEKKYSERASRDVISRIKRSLTLSGESEVSSETLYKIEESEKFKTLSINIKSQLRRAVKLFKEYKHIN